MVPESSQQYLTCRSRNFKRAIYIDLVMTVYVCMRYLFGHVSPCPWNYKRDEIKFFYSFNEIHEWLNTINRYNLWSNPVCSGIMKDRPQTLSLDWCFSYLSSCHWSHLLCLFQTRLLDDDFAAITDWGWDGSYQYLEPPRHTEDAGRGQWYGWSASITKTNQTGERSWHVTVTQGAHSLHCQMVLNITQYLHIIIFFQQLMLNINQAICLRLDTIENKLEKITYRTKALEEKLEQFTDKFTTSKEGQDKYESRKWVNIQAS